MPCRLFFATVSDRRFFGFMRLRIFYKSEEVVLRFLFKKRSDIRMAFLECCRDCRALKTPKIDSQTAFQHRKASAIAESSPAQPFEMYPDGQVLSFKMIA